MAQFLEDRKNKISWTDHDGSVSSLRAVREPFGVAAAIRRDPSRRTSGLAVGRETFATSTDPIEHANNELLVLSGSLKASLRLLSTKFRPVMWNIWREIWRNWLRLKQRHPKAMSIGVSSAVTGLVEGSVLWCLLSVAMNMHKAPPVPTQLMMVALGLQ